MKPKPCPSCESYRMRTLVAEDEYMKLRREYDELQRSLGSLRIENAALSKEVSALADVRDSLLATLGTVPQFARLASERLRAEQAAAVAAVQKVAGSLPE